MGEREAGEKYFFAASHCSVRCFCCDGRHHDRSLRDIVRAEHDGRDSVVGREHDGERDDGNYDLRAEHDGRHVIGDDARHGKHGDDGYRHGPGDLFRRVDRFDASRHQSDKWDRQYDKRGCRPDESSDPAVKQRIASRAGFSLDFRLQWPRYPAHGLQSVQSESGQNRQEYRSARDHVSHQYPARPERSPARLGPYI